MKRLNLKGKERFLVIRTDRIGDVILSTPVPEAIKRKYPNSQVTMMVSSYTRDLFNHNPWVDEVITYDLENIKGFFKLVKSLREKGFDVAILLRPDLRLALILFLSGIRVRIGTGYRAYGFLFNHRIYQHRKTIEKHEVEYNLSMLFPVGIFKEKTMPRIYLSSEEERYSRRIFEDLNIREEDVKIVIHPGSGHSSLNYPLEKFALLADKLIEGFSSKVILTGNKNEEELSEKMRALMRNQPFNLTGQTDLRALCSLLKGADLLICNSTGPMHMAAALGTPVLALFSPLFVASPRRWGPYGEGHEVISPPVKTCYKCNPERCSDFNCMEKIDPEEIILRIKRILKGKALKVN
jgi:heptosyltransferase-2